MSFGDIPTTTATSGMEPFGILFEGFQPLALADTALAVVSLVDGLQPLKNVTGGYFLSAAGVLDRHPDFIFYPIV